MTDRWLDSCLLDSDGRIFLDRDGETFGDVLRYLRGGADFLLELVNYDSFGGRDHHQQHGGAVNNHGLNHLTASSLYSYASSAAAAAASMTSSSSSMMMRRSKNSSNSTATMDRLRRLRTEADYYGLHQLVHDIDSITIGSKIVFMEECWGRVAGGFVNAADRAAANAAANHNNGNQNNGQLQNEDNNAPNGHNNAMLQERQRQQRGDQDNIVMREDDNGNNHDNNINVNNQDDEEEDAEGEDDDEEHDEEHDNEEENFDEEEDDGDEDIAEEEEVEEDDEEEFEETYKNWSWSRQFGNPDILRPHPTHSSSMVVGQDGTYLLLLRFAAALPSPLARIKWEEEEEDRRVTRSGVRARRGRNRGRLGRIGEDNYSSNGNDNGVGGGGNNSHDDDDGDTNHSKDLEEDYFVTVNIEAPLQTVMDAVDESQTHFPILRAGLWDYRTEEEVLNEDPVYATVSAMDVVSLCAGDILSVSFMNDEVSREKSPLPDDCPPEWVNSLTLVKVCGNTLARYERSKQSPATGFVQGNNSPVVDAHSSRQGGGGISSRHNKSGGLAPFSTPEKRSLYRRTSSQNALDQFDEESSHDDDSHNHHQQEEFDRSLTRTAHWTKPRNDFDSTPFEPRLHSDASTLEFPHPGQYLLLGRVAVGCRRDATFQPVLSGGPLEGHRAQLSVRSAGGRLLHAVGAFVFEDKPRLSGSDLSILSENGMFNDVVYIPRSGTELSIRTTGDCRLHPEGTEVGPFCSAVSQCLSLLLIDDDIMEVDRYMLRTVRSDGPNPQRVIRWYHTRSATSPRGRGKGGTSLEPSLFDVDEHRLVWRGSCCSSYTHNNPVSTVLIMGSIPPLHRGYVVALLKNNQPLAISITPESLDMKGRHCHYFQEIVQLRDGDEITIADCAYGERWRDLFAEPRRVELDTRMGHLSFVVLQKYLEEEGGVVAGEGGSRSSMMMM